MRQEVGASLGSTSCYPSSSAEVCYTAAHAAVKSWLHLRIWENLALLKLLRSRTKKLGTFGLVHPPSQTAWCSLNNASTGNILERLGNEAQQTASFAHNGPPQFDFGDRTTFAVPPPTDRMSSECVAGVMDLEVGSAGTRSGLPPSARGCKRRYRTAGCRKS